MPSYQTKAIWSLPMPNSVSNAVQRHYYLFGGEVLRSQEAETEINADGTKMEKTHWWKEESSALSWIEFVKQYNPDSTSINFLP